MKRFAYLLLALLISGCSQSSTYNDQIQQSQSTAADIAQGENRSGPGALEMEDAISYSLETIPEWDGSTPSVIINDNQPFFDLNEIDRDTAFEAYGVLDELGRCTSAVANIDPSLMPTEPRESISSVKPTGWMNNAYDFVDGGYLYNRCHLIGFQLTGENANPNNLITGTRYMNVQGMLPFENEVADYVKSTGNHVYYQVTPIFDGLNLVADGVLMQAESIEDNGQGVRYNVFCYNVQPGVEIDYATGQNWENFDIEEDTEIYTTQTYVLNTNSKKVHKPDCPSVEKMSAKNKQETTGTIDQLLAQGYTLCQTCFN